MSNNYKVPCWTMVYRDFELDIVADSPEEAIEIANAMLSSSDRDDRERVDLTHHAGEYLRTGDEPIEVVDDPYQVIVTKD